MFASKRYLYFHIREWERINVRFLKFYEPWFKNEGQEGDLSVHLLKPLFKTNQKIFAMSLFE